ncbi:glycosyltransferase family 4 protein [Novosphingobium mathurense]|uniref:Glycosyltransferase involved in cell wall bisynthesis n=1 Tax=Novosphingobium mathurense TaxID=428990 RepID=A0A1U6HMK2_9SPHN|nr:glycosyltransferase family 4 protein [Novosphingobium mathurense]SLJ96851.1 Glycosyltransferase involved in cell wall bisynthesis [Novosphingobium mathurense]
MTSIDQIVVINDFASASRGGATVIALQAVRLYRRLGYPVTYICGDAPTTKLDDMGVTQVTLGSDALLELPARHALMQGLHNPAAESLVADWIRDNDTRGTVYHLHNWSQILSPSIFRALREVEDRLIVTCHDFFNICPNGGFSHFPSAMPCQHRSLSARCLVSQCDRISTARKYWRALRHMRLNSVARFAENRATFTFLHDRMLEKFANSGFRAKNLVAIPNPVEAWTDERVEAERNEGFLFVGRLGHDKGADLAIKAAGAAGQKITLIGSGKLGTLEARKNRDARVIGWQDREGIAEIARHCRAIIVPSRVTEPFGLVILEAAMSGLPVILASHAYLADDAVRLGFAKTFNIDRFDQLASLMGQLAADDDQVGQMSRAGFAGGHALCHTPDTWIGAFIDIFEEKLHSSGRAREPALRRSYA